MNRDSRELVEFLSAELTQAARGHWPGPTPSISRLARAALGNVPKHAGRINHIGNPQSPRLNRRRLWTGHAEAPQQIKPL